MKKRLLIFILTILANCIFFNAANSEQSSLKAILGADWIYSHANSKIIDQKADELNKNLNLSDEQKKKTEELSLSSAKKINIYRVQFIEEKKKLITLRKSHAPIQRIQAQVKELQSVKARLNVTRKKNIQEFEAILSQEQLVFFDAFKADLRKIKEQENHAKREVNAVYTRKDALNALEPSE